MSNYLISLCFKTGVIFFTCLYLSACAGSTLKAPCDENATFCGKKTKINQW